LNGYNLSNTDPIRVEWAAVSKPVEVQTHSPDSTQFRHEMPTPMPQYAFSANQMMMKSDSQPNFPNANRRKSSNISFHKFWTGGPN
jgi:hypothetical protein